MMINFRLYDFDKIHPVGKKPYLSWFWLTDGDLWLTFGDTTIYEYTKEAITYFEGKETPYNDYYLVRFLEDFTKLFESISESVPDKFYKLTSDLKLFRNNTRKWLDINGYDEDKFSDFYFEEYDKLNSWTWERTFDSGHLIGGPHLSFFRCKDKIKIVWDTEWTLENGINLWTAKDGSFEMEFSEFVKEVRLFGNNFFKAMDKQVAQTLSQDWKNIKVDKEWLVKEHSERKSEFEKNFSFLEQNEKKQTNWTEIEQLFDRMANEIK